MTGGVTMPLDSAIIMRLHVTIGEPLPVGATQRGFLVILPITGGHFEGPGIRGRVCPGGADWNTRLDDAHSHVFAKYWLQTDDGAVISVENEGVINNERMGDSVIKTTPRFLVDHGGKYSFLESGVFVGELNIPEEPGAVDIVIHKMA